MFLPFEGLYAEVVNMGLIEDLQHNYKINIAGPSTMAAMLNALRMGFATLAIQKKSGEVWEILKAAKTEFGKFEEGLINIQKRLRTTDSDLDKLIGMRTRAINRKLDAVEKIDNEQAESILELK
jgi:DNA recombination protein RmuC